MDKITRAEFDEQRHRRQVSQEGSDVELAQVSAYQAAGPSGATHQVDMGGGHVVGGLTSAAGAMKAGTRVLVSRSSRGVVTHMVGTAPRHMQPTDATISILYDPTGVRCC